MGSLFRSLMEKYDGDFVLNQKAKTLYALLITLFAVTILMQISFVIRGLDDPKISIPVALMSIVTLGLTALTRRGYYALAANLSLTLALGVLWTVMFIADLIHPVEKIDTMVLILGALSMTPLIVTRYRIGIFVYFVVNWLIFILFCTHLSISVDIPGAIIVEYLIDGSIALAFMGMASYQIFNINHRAIRKSRETENYLRKSKERYRNIFENIQDVYYETTMDGIIMEISPSVQDLFDYTQEDLIGKSLFDLNIRSEQKNEYLEKLMGNGRLSDYELRLPDKQGNLRHCSIITKLIRDEQSRPLKIVGSLRDISDRKRAEHEKKSLEEQLARSQKMEALGLLAGGVAHDLNNVLSGTVSYPDLLLADLPVDSKFRKPIQTIQKSGQKAADIVQDLLTLARRGVTNTQVLNINAIIEDYLCSPECEKLKDYHPGVRIETDYCEELMNIKGSAVHLRKTIMNLVSNAAEAQPEGGLIRITTENRYVDKPVKGYVTVAEGDYIVVRVKDEGMGIAREDLSKIFEPFYTKKVMGRSGTGLGMAVVWGTVQDHNGYIQVESAEGTGTVFELFLPITREMLPEQGQVIPIESYCGENEFILIVDDVPEQREIASQMIRKLGYQVEAVASGEGAVAYLANNPVDLLLLDMIMDPGIDGLETYRRILQVSPGQKAIIASGYAENERVKQAQLLGAGQYIRKPYTLERIGLAIKAELATRRSKTA